MDLRHVVDGVLLEDTKKLAVREREIMSQVLHHLREIDRRKLYADLGFSSMFAYCTDELKYSPDQAQRRISACRMLSELPQIEKKLDDGSLNLTVLGMANTFFREHRLGLKDKQLLLEKIEGKSKKEVEVLLAPELSPALVSGTARRYSKTQTKVTLILDDAVVEKLKELQALLSHTKRRELPELIDFLCTRELEKRKGSARAAARGIPACVRKAVWAKAQGRCQHPECSSKHFLQIHHVRAFSEGGTHAIENLKLLCHAHHARGHDLKTYRPYPRS